MKGGVVRRVLHLVGVHRQERRAEEQLTVQRLEHDETLKAVRDAKAAAYRIRNEADDVISEARHAERLLEGRPRPQ